MSASEPRPPEWPVNPFWDFSVALYSRPGVGSACLALQDRHGLDVNLLLFCVYAAACGKRLTAADLTSLNVSVGPWRRRVVEPLRQVRRTFKEPGHGAMDALAERLRRQVLEAEIEAERGAQTILHRALPLEIAATAPDPSSARDNLEAYLAAAGLAHRPETARDLTVLLEAIRER